MALNEDCYWTILRRVEARTLFNCRWVSHLFYRLALREINARQLLVRPPAGSMELNDIAEKYHHLDLTAKPAKFTRCLFDGSLWSSYPMLTRLQTVHLSDIHYSVDFILAFTSVQTLSLRNVLWTNEQLVQFTRLTSLELLGDTPYCSALSQLTQLTRLYSMEYSPYGLSTVEPLTRLRHLSLHEDDLSLPRELGVFPLLQKLESLTIWQTPMSNEIFTELSQLPHLREFEYFYPSSPLPPGFSQLTGLESLVLDCSAVDESILWGPLASSQLRHLELHLPRDTIQDMDRFVAGLARLTHLRCNNIFFRPDDLIYMAQITELTLHNFGADFNEAGFQHLTGVRHLTLTQTKKNLPEPVLMGTTLSVLTQLESLNLCFPGGPLLGVHLSPLTRLQRLIIQSAPCPGTGDLRLI